MKMGYLFPDLTKLECFAFVPSCWPNLHAAVHMWNLLAQRGFTKALSTHLAPRELVLEWHMKEDTKTLYPSQRGNVKLLPGPEIDYQRAFLCSVLTLWACSCPGRHYSNLLTQQQAWGTKWHCERPKLCFRGGLDAITSQGRECREKLRFLHHMQTFERCYLWISPLTGPWRLKFHFFPLPQSNTSRAVSLWQGLDITRANSAFRFADLGYASPHNYFLSPFPLRFQYSKEVLLPLALPWHRICSIQT